jgi:hypothetical protein
MIRELATKRLASPPRKHLHVDTTILSKGIPKKHTSKNVDALKPTFDEEDSEIEISGPFPLSLKPESSKTVPRAALKRAVVQKANAKPCVVFLSFTFQAEKVTVYILSSVFIYHNMHPAMAHPTLH